MLSTKKTYTVDGKSLIDGEIAAGYRAVINSDNPEEVSFSSWQQDKSLYKENRVQCRADYAEFEEGVYAMLEELLAEMTTEEAGE